MRTESILSLFLLLFLGLLLPFSTCGDDDDNGDEMEPDDDSAAGGTDDDETNDDTISDDDLADDDTMDDDTGDDDTVFLSYPNPILSDGHWDPNPTGLADFGLGELYWYSQLKWSVCDRDNDLLPDGLVYMYQPGGDPWSEWPKPWAEFHDPPEFDLTNAADCEQPIEVGIITLFGPQSAPPAPGEYCIDGIESTDSAGNWSNMLENICVTHE